MGYKDLELQNGETLIYSGPANEVTKRGNSKGGMLFLTDQRLAFQAHALNFGSKRSSYNLSSIQIEGNSVNIKVTSNFGVSFNITMMLKNGEEISFVVAKKQMDDWVKNISSALTRFVRSNVTMPPDAPKEQVESTLSKISVVQCGSCGAFVVVTLGAITHCEYCGRPHTL